MAHTFSDEAVASGLIYRRLGHDEVLQPGEGVLLVTLREDGAPVIRAPHPWENLFGNALPPDTFLVDCNEHMASMVCFELLPYQVSTAAGHSFQLGFTCRTGLCAAWLGGLADGMRLRDRLTADEAAAQYQQELNHAVAQALRPLYDQEQPYYNTVLSKRSEWLQPVRHAVFTVMLRHGLLINNASFRIERITQPVLEE